MGVGKKPDEDQAVVELAASQFSVNEQSGAALITATLNVTSSYEVLVG